MAFSSNAERAALVLVALGEAGLDGMPLKEIALAVGDTKPATHRTLAALALHGFVEQTRQRGHYRLGVAVFRLAQLRSSAAERMRRWRPAVMELGARFGASCFLLDRSGLDAVILDMHIGGTGVQILGSGVGARLPLGYGLGGMAILAMQQADNREAILVANRDRYVALDLDPRDVRAYVDVVRGCGYDFRRGAYIPAVSGVAVPIMERDGSCVSAITVSMLNEQFTDRLLVEILAAMEAQIVLCSDGTCRVAPGMAPGVAAGA